MHGSGPHLDGNDIIPLKQHTGADFGYRAQIALNALVCGESAFAADLTWRVHWPRDKKLCAAMIEFALNPVVLFLLVEPRTWERSPAEGPATALEEVDHHQSVLALTAFDSQPRLNPGQKGFC